MREGRSWNVAPIDLEEIEQVFAYRLANEIAAVKIACACADRRDCETLAAMLASCDDEAPRERWHKIGLEFHIDLARLSGNEFLTRAVRDAMQRLSRARWLEMRDDSGRARAWREHAEILAAVEKGDAEAAAAILTRHIRRAARASSPPCARTGADCARAGLSIVAA